MTPRLWHIALYAGIALAIVGALVFGLDSCHQSKGVASEHNAAVASGEAIAHQSQAQVSDSQVADLAAKLSAREADLGRLNSERDALLRKLAAKPKPGADSVGDNPSPSDPVGTDDSQSGDIADLTLKLEASSAVIAKDAEVIQAQAYFIEGQKAEIAALVISRDEWKATAEARERQALAQEAATKAWRDAVGTSRNKGRMEGALAWELIRRVAGAL